MTDLLPIGTRVRATFPNASWGEGEIIDADANTKVRNETTGRMIRRKPYVVRRDDDVRVEDDVWGYAESLGDGTVTILGPKQLAAAHRV